MSWAATAPAILARLGTVAGVGNLYAGDRHMRDATRVTDLLRVPVQGEPDQLRAWFLGRTAISEGHYTQTRTLARERYQLRGVMAMLSERESEREWQAVADAVLARLRGITSIGSARYLEAGRASMAAAEFAEVVCHVAVINLEVEEEYTIGSVAQPAHAESTAGTRPVYGEVSEQLAFYLTLAAAGAPVRLHRERPWRLDEEDFADAFTVPLASDPTRDAVRSWIISRGDDPETRGLGNLVTASPRWGLAYRHTWSDNEESYSDAQDHVDAVRAVFRGVGNLGDPVNPTMALSSPLQMTSFGAVMLMSRMCHAVECSVAVEEVVHV
jgi:hypothetical protein